MKHQYNPIFSVFLCVSLCNNYQNFQDKFLNYKRELVLFHQQNELIKRCLSNLNLSTYLNIVYKNQDFPTKYRL